MKNKIILILLILFIAVSGFSQWTCRSKIGAHLTPFKKDFPLLWALEFTGGHGYMNDRDISNLMMFAALDYTKNKNQIYIEGGRKSWHNSLGSPAEFNTGHGRDGYFQQQRFGIREVFYKHKDENNTLTIGFQSMTFGDYFLVNERGFGLSYIKSLNDFKLYITGATVHKNFSRFGSFCSVHYTYNLLRDRHYAYIGDKMGETNFAGFVLKWKPSKKSSSDENEFSEFNSESKSKLFNEGGIIFYDEFGSGIDTMHIHYGLMAGWNLPGKLNLETEILHQYKPDHQTIIYHLNIYRQLNFGKYGQTIFSLGYYGDYDIDKHALPYASFSNLFIGEVMRMDVMDMPLYQFAIKHRYPKWKSQIKFQATQQFTDKHISEYNIAIGKTFLKHAKLTLMFSRMDADVLDEIFYMGRAELRITL